MTGPAGPAGWRLAAFRDVVTSLPAPLRRGDELDPRLVVHDDGRVRVLYAPLEHVPPHRGVDVVLVGLAPGRQQLRQALAACGDALRAGATDVDALAAARAATTFDRAAVAATAAMLDGIGLAGALGLASCASLWGADAARQHRTAAVRHCVLGRGDRNWSGTSPAPLSHPVLRAVVEHDLAATVAALPTALVVALGTGAASSVAHLAATGAVDPARCLLGLPHPSGANVHRPRLFAERRAGLAAEVAAWAAGRS